MPVANGTFEKHTAAETTWTVVNSDLGWTPSSSVSVAGRTNSAGRRQAVGGGVFWRGCPPPKAGGAERHHHRGPTATSSADAPPVSDKGVSEGGGADSLACRRSLSSGGGIIDCQINSRQLSQLCSQAYEHARSPLPLGSWREVSEWTTGRGTIDARLASYRTTTTTTCGRVTQPGVHACPAPTTPESDSQLGAGDSDSEDEYSFTGRAVGSRYLDTRMAYLEAQENRAASPSPWLQFHLGQSMGYVDLARKLQRKEGRSSNGGGSKKVEDHTPSLARAYSMMDIRSDSWTGHPQARPATGTGTNTSSSRQRYHQKRPSADSLDVKDTWWVIKGERSRSFSSVVGKQSRPLDGVQLPKSPSSNMKTVESKRTQANPHKSGELSRLRSPQNRLLGTTRSELASGLGRNGQHARNVDVLLLKLDDPVKFPRPPLGTPYRFRSFSRESSISSVASPFPDMLSDTDSHCSISTSPDKRAGEDAAVESPDEHPSGAPPPSPSLSDGNHHNNHHQSARYHPNVGPKDDLDHTGEHANERSSGRSSLGGTNTHHVINEGQVGLEEAPAPPSKRQQLAASLSISNYVCVTLDEDEDEAVESIADDEAHLPPLASESISIINPSLKQESAKKKDKLSVRFSVNNDVHEYSPWKPIDSQGTDDEGDDNDGDDGHDDDGHATELKAKTEQQEQQQLEEEEQVPIVETDTETTAEMESKEGAAKIVVDNELYFTVKVLEDP